jgi:hypothetical protein
LALDPVQSQILRSAQCFPVFDFQIRHLSVSGTMNLRIK